MKIAIIGASGFIGSALLKEAAERGLEITTITRNPEKIPQGKNITALKGNIEKTDEIAEILKGHDAVLSAFSGHSSKDIYDTYTAGFRSILKAVKKAGVPRFLIVGGAGSLYVGPETQLLDTQPFPQDYKPTAEGARTALNELKEEKDLNWTMLSPSMVIFPGEKTGKFRLAEDTLIQDKNGESKISTGDYAKAFIDELENPKYPRQRFTVGY